MVRKIYPPPQCADILGIPISKTGIVSDKLLWKHSGSGGYKVKNSYKLLLKDFVQNSSLHSRPYLIPTEVWNLIWKVNVPHKISLFVWKLIHDSLPTYLTLRIEVLQLPILAQCARKRMNHLPTCFFTILLLEHAGMVPFRQYTHLN